jgi:hypothetical protein
MKCRQTSRFPPIDEPGSLHGLAVLYAKFERNCRRYLWNQKLTQEIFAQSDHFATKSRLERAGPHRCGIAHTNLVANLRKEARQLIPTKYEEQSAQKAFAEETNVGALAGKASLYRITIQSDQLSGQKEAWAQNALHSGSSNKAQDLQQHEQPQSIGRIHFDLCTKPPTGLVCSRGESKSRRRPHERDTLRQS